MRRSSTIAFALLACSPSDPEGEDGSATATGSAATTVEPTSGTGSGTSASTSSGETEGDSEASSGAMSSSSSSTGNSGSTDESSAGDDSSSSTGDDGNVLYVRDDGLDGNPGTREAPLRTIQWAITQAGVIPGIDTIRVAEGDYDVDYANDAHIVMVEGVSLLGGWSADWNDHDPDAYASNIVDISAVAIPSTEPDPHRAIEIPAGVTAATVLDGFRIGIARGQYRTSVLAAGDATISNNVIAPESTHDPVWMYGVSIQHASPTIVGNRIVVEGNGVTGLGTGIHAVDSDGVFANNTIVLHEIQSSAYGVYLSQGSAQVLANSIHAGDSTTNVWLLYMISAATPTIDNNVFEVVTFDGVCLGSNAASSVPAFARNNVLHCNYTFFGSDPLRSWTTIQELQDGLPTATANVKLPDEIVDPADDLTLDASVPCSVTQGGRDLGASVSVDIDDVARSAPYSIGAHEWDDGCV